ncbi:hypothetical protein AAG906_040589 [Vitis piasezkii]
MITRSQRGIIKPNPKYALTSTTNSTNIPHEPHNIRVALAHPGWKTTMDKELKALHKNKTWVLVPHTSNMHVIGSKWVFKPKLKLDGSLDRLKARVVAKEYHQVDGLDYTKTFSPVIKPGAIQMEWLISNIQHMCASFKRLSMVSNKHLVLDDILLTGSSTALVSTFIQLLSSEFEMNDLGQIHHFLGIEISQTSYGIHLSQSHYAITILERANMVDCKPMSTSLEAKTRTSSNNVVLEDLSYFKGLVDLSYSVNYASQFMHAPTIVHLKMIGWGVQPHGDPSLDTIRFLEKISSLGMSFILKDLHISLASTPTLYCDDTSALHMTINPVSHARSKHIEPLTRPMSKAALNNFRTKLCLQSRHSLREGISTTKRLGVNCGTQGSDKVEHNYGSDKVENSHNSCYNSGETLKDEGVSMATTSTQNEAPSVVGRAQEEAAAAGSDGELNGLLRRRQGGMPKGRRKPELKVQWNDEKGKSWLKYTKPG